MFSWIKSYFFPDDHPFYEKPFEVMSDQDLYSMLIDMDDMYFERLENLIDLAKGARREKMIYLDLKKKEKAQHG